MSMINILIAILVFAFLIKFGFFILKSLATPPPEPPPSGELRKVKLLYRCELCGTEVRMTVAPDENPEPPRHCMENMEHIPQEN